MSSRALAADTVAIRSLRARGISGPAVRQQLAGVAVPATRRWVFVRRVVLRGRADQLGRAMSAALAQLAEDSRTEVLSFADFPAVGVACARAALGGGLGGAWHWRALGLPATAGPGEALAFLLRSWPLEAGAVVAALAAEGLLAPVWRDLSEPQADAVTQALAQAAQVALPPWPEAGGLEPPAGERLPGFAAPLLARAAAFWAPVLRPLPPRHEAVRTAAVLALLRFAPAVLRTAADSPVWPALLARLTGGAMETEAAARPVRGAAPEAAATAPSADADDPPAAAAPESAPVPQAAAAREAARRGEASAPPRSDGSHVDAAQAGAAAQAAATPAGRPDAPDSPAWQALLADVTARRPAADPPAEATEPQTAPAAETQSAAQPAAVPVAVTTHAAVTAEAAQPGSDRPVVPGAPALPSAALPASRPHGEPIATAWGGVLFLINLLQRLDISDRLEACGSEAPTGWRVLLDLGLCLGMPPDEPLALFLDAQDLQTAMPPALRAALLAEIEAMLTPDGPWPLPLAQPGLLHATETHLDLDFASTRIDIAVRLAGLDLDPGWVPWLGRIVALHYPNLPTLFAMGA